MGKRSSFQRRDRDFYPTPREAVLPLIPHLPPRSTFIEPCAGDGALCDHLNSFGMHCIGASDIEPKGRLIERMDALSAPIYSWTADYIITNPPWSIDILHPMIERFSSVLPTWLLFYADWVHTQQSAAFMPLLRKVVSVGRVKWIPGSKMTSKDNVAWHLFDANSAGSTIFVGRAV